MANMEKLGFLQFPPGIEELPDGSMMELVKHSIGLPSIYNQTDLSLSSGSNPYNQ